MSAQGRALKVSQTWLSSHIIPDMGMTGFVVLQQKSL